jgi:hypothetical protein
VENRLVVWGFVPSGFLIIACHGLLCKLFEVLAHLSDSYRALFAEKPYCNHLDVCRTQLRSQPPRPISHEHAKDGEVESNPNTAGEELHIPDSLSEVGCRDHVQALAKQEFRNNIGLSLVKYKRIR